MPSLSGPSLICHLRALRERAGLSQQALGERVGVSRQAINAIEGGRQVPSTVLSLGLARALGVSVEALFALPDPDGLPVALARADVTARRVLVGRVRGRWVAHPLPADAPRAADALLSAGPPDAPRVKPLVDPAELDQRLLIAGCAPLLGLLASRPGGSLSWLPASTGRALDLLDAGLVHVAGLHAWDPTSSAANRDLLQRRLGSRPLVLVHLTRWRQGLLAAPGNPLGLRTLHDLSRPNLRFARRAPGAGATRLVRSALEGALPHGPLARGHAEVARLVQIGAADAGVAIEAVALAAGLDFVPLSEERFDLVFPAIALDHPRIGRLLDALRDRGFRTEASALGGYDLGLLGELDRTGQAA